MYKIIEIDQYKHSNLTKRAWIEKELQEASTYGFKLKFVSESLLILDKED